MENHFTGHAVGAGGKLCVEAETRTKLEVSVKVQNEYVQCWLNLYEHMSVGFASCALRHICNKQEVRKPSLGARCKGAKAHQGIRDGRRPDTLQKGWIV